MIRSQDNKENLKQNLENNPFYINLLENKDNNSDNNISNNSENNQDNNHDNNISNNQDNNTSNNSKNNPSENQNSNNQSNTSNNQKNKIEYIDEYLNEAIIENKSKAITITTPLCKDLSRSLKLLQSNTSIKQLNLIGNKLCLSSDALTKYLLSYNNIKTLSFNYKLVKKIDYLIKAFEEKNYKWVEFGKIRDIETLIPILNCKLENTQFGVIYKNLFIKEIPLLNEHLIKTNIKHFDIFFTIDDTEYYKNNIIYNKFKYYKYAYLKEFLDNDRDDEELEEKRNIWCEKYDILKKETIPEIIKSLKPFFDTLQKNKLMHISLNFIETTNKNYDVDMAYYMLDKIKKEYNYYSDDVIERLLLRRKDGTCY